MNYIQHLNTFLWLLQREKRLTPAHISLYLALFHYWNRYRFQNPFPLFRERLMQLSGIGSKNTYSKCLKDLHRFGYIVHNPSLHRNHRPKVSLIRWKVDAEINRQLSMFHKNVPPGNEPLTVSDMGHLLTTIGTLTRPHPVNSPVTSGQLTGSDLGHSIKQEDINSKPLESDAHTPELSSEDPLGEDTNPAAPGGAPQKDIPAFMSIPPPLDDVHKYFAAKNYLEREASRFFNHYQANGWKQGGNRPIIDWQAAAEKWITNSFETSNHQQNKSIQHARDKSTQLPGHLHLQQNKNYEDPL